MLRLTAAAAAATPRSRAPRRPKPNLDVPSNANYQAAKQLSAALAANASRTPAHEKKTVLIIGGGLAGLSCGKYLSDAGHAPTIV